MTLPPTDDGPDIISPGVRDLNAEIERLLALVREPIKRLVRGHNLRHGLQTGLQTAKDERGGVELS
jgi:hypothetical protein